MKTTVRGFRSSAIAFIHFLLAVCLTALPFGAAFAAVTVTLTAPTNGAVFTAGSNITLSATASATQGYTVSKVEFFHGGTNLIATDTSSPYSITWNSVPAGSYSLTAKATAIKKNNPDQTATSTAVSITVNALPSVSMTSPAGGAVYAAPGSMTLTATASDSDGTIQKVEFFHGGTNLIATVTSSPYTYDWSGVAAGSYSLTAKATDNLNGATTSSPVAVTVTNAPTVALTSPTNNATFSAPASVTLTATASDSDGSIQQVEFFHGGTNLIATVTTSPYTYNWTNVGAGSYSLTAKATDNLGIATTSTPVNITVTAGAPAGLYFIHPDHLNTPRQIYNDQQQLAWRWDQQEPFGISAPDENPAGVGTFEFPLRFPGQYADKETNVHYNYFRDYDPGIGRYVEGDPIGLRGGISLYAYVRVSPLRNRDRFGLFEAIEGESAEKQRRTGNSTIACDGKGGIKIVIADQSSDPCIRDCVEIHEGVHRDEAIVFNPQICARRPDDTLIMALPHIGAPSEIRASVAEIQCYLRKLAGLPDCDPCRPKIEHAIGDAYDYMEKNRERARRFPN